MINGIIYQAINKINKKKYVGATVNSLSVRVSGHKHSAKKGCKNHFHRGLRKWGIDNFEWSIIHKDILSEELLERLEINYIAILRPEYNEKPGGKSPSGFKMPLEAIEKSRSKIRGRPLSDEHKEKISEGNKGKVLSEESIEKLRNRYFSPEHRRKIGLKHKGKVLSEETRLRVSKGLTGLKQSKETIEKRISKTKGKKRSQKFCEDLRKRNLGRKLSEETKKKISEWNKLNPRDRGPNGAFIPKDSIANQDK